MSYSYTKGRGWLLFFYSISSRPVSNRMKIWRRLSRAGAVQIKGSVYILPMNEDHYEFFQWLVSEVSEMGGEAAFTRVETLDSMKDQDVIDIFNAHKDEEYKPISKSLEDLEAKSDSIKKGSGSQNLKALSRELAGTSKSYDEVFKTDFFSSKAGIALRQRLNSLKTITKGLSGTAPEIKPAVVRPRKFKDFQGKIWVSRRRPFVDRMASAWLIKNFIDRKATFRLMNDNDIASVAGDHITFDLSEGMSVFEMLYLSKTG